jgi:hypothetical protein
MKSQAQVRLQGRETKGWGRGRAIRAGWAALVLGGLVWAAPAESAAKERCTTKPVVCARMKALRAADARRSAEAAPVPVHVAQYRDARPERCTSKAIVCARLRNAPFAPPPMYVAAQSTGDRCTTKPSVCARLKVRRGGEPVTLANDGTAPTID